MLTSETMVIGAILGEGRSIRTVRAALETADFQTQLGRGVFAAACALDDEGICPDPVLIRERAGQMGEHLDTRELAQAMDVASTGELSVHLEGMKTQRLRKTLLETVSAAQLALMEEGGDPRSICTRLQTGLLSAAHSGRDRRLVTGAQAMSEYVDHRLGIDSGTKRAFVSTGYAGLDKALGGGFVPAGLYILAARPGCGKTTLGLQIAERAAKQGVPTLFLSLEMPVLQLTARRLAVESGVDTTDILMHALTEQQHSRIAGAMEELAVRPLEMIAPGLCTVEGIGLLARQVKDCGLVVVDYLGLLHHAGGRSLYEQVTKTSNALKRLACTLGVPILCLAQLNREVAGRNTPPRLSDLRDSGAIEQDADGVILLSRTPPPEKGKPAVLQCAVAKNRHGPMGGGVALNWYLNNGRITA